MLTYLADRYGGADTPEKRAEISKWVLFANATLVSGRAIKGGEGALPLPPAVAPFCSANPVQEEVGAVPQCHAL